MINKKLLNVLKLVDRYYFIKVTTTLAVVVTFIILQARYLTDIINAVFIDHAKLQAMDILFYLLLTVIFVKAIGQFYYSWYHTKLGLKIKGVLRKKIACAYIDKGPIALKNMTIGTVSTQVIDGVEAIEPYFSEFLPQLMFTMVSTPLVCLFVWKNDMVSGIIMLITGPLIPLFMILIGILANKAHKKQWLALQDINAYLMDLLRGVVTLKIFQQLTHYGEKVDQVSEMFQKRTMSVLKISFLSALVLEFMATISTAVVAVFLGLRLLYGHIDFSTAFLVLLLCPEYYQPIRQLGMKFHAAMGATVAFDTVSETLDKKWLVDGVYEKEKVKTDLKAKEKSVKNSNKFQTLTFNTVSYSYPLENRNTVNMQEKDLKKFQLKNISFSVNSREKIAIVGKTGSGKSTLIAILMKFLPYTQGEVLIDNKNLSDLEFSQWNSYYAYVPQHPKLFKGTLRYNLTLGNSNILESDLARLIHEVGLNSVVSALPQGLETVLSEGGQLLSGGEIQLIAIVRAYLKNSPMIILDEPTSALDLHTEQKIRKVCFNLYQDKTVITIAHRLKTVRESDQILVMSHGECVETGTHSSLIEKKGYYYALMQKGGENA